MLKFLRKYNKITLVVFGSLLMVVFLLPQAIQQLGSNIQRRTVAEIESTGTKVSMLDRRTASGEQSMLESIAPGPMGPLGLGLNASEDRTQHWLLFSHEAVEAGLVGNETAGTQFLTSVAEVNAQSMVLDYYMSLGLPPQQALQFLSQPMAAQQIADARNSMLPELQAGYARIGGINGLNIRESAESVAKLEGVYRLRGLHNNAAMPSAPRLLAYAREQDNAAIADMMFIGPDAADAVVPPTEPTEGEILAHFERYRDVVPGTRDGDNAEDRFGFGYRRGERVKLAWLTLPRSVFEDAIELDPVEVRRRFLEQEEAAAADDPDAPRQAFEDARASIERQLIAERADRLMDEATGTIRALIQRSLDAIDRSPGNDTYVIPEGWTPPDLAEIARVAVLELNESTGLSLEAFPTNLRDDQWLTRQELQRLPGIGTAQIAIGGNSIAFQNGPMMVRELLGNPSSLFPLQVGVPAYEFPVVNTRGDRFFFTVLDSREASAPDSVDEVRESVVRDLARAKRFEALQDWSSELRVILLTRGLAETEQVVMDRISAVPGLTASVRPSIEQRVRVTRRPVQTAVDALRVESVREEIVRLAESLDPTVDPLTLTEAGTTMLLEVPELGGLLAVRVRAFEPLTRERFRALTQRYIVELTQTEFNEARAELGDSGFPFALPSLVERLQYRVIGEDDEQETPPPGEPGDGTSDDTGDTGTGTEG